MATLNRPSPGLLLGLAIFGAAAAALPRPGAVAMGAPQVPLEYAVKANYLYKFAPFVRWPAEALPPSGPFNICLIGENSFGTVLDEAVRGQQIDGHPIAIHRLVATSALPACQILFVGRTTQPAATILRAAADYPILTVTDHDRAAGGGMIDFTLQGGRVRFAIDAAAARTSRLQISSKLLGLATAVNGR